MDQNGVLGLKKKGQNDGKRLGEPIPSSLNCSMLNAL